MASPHNEPKQALQARLRALEAEMLAVPVASRTPNVRRAYALDCLEGIRRYFALDNIADNQIMRELAEALQAADVGVRHPLLALEGDLLHCPHLKSMVMQIQAEAAALLALGVEATDNKKVSAEKICALLERCGFVKGNNRPYSYWSVIKWGEQCQQGQHLEANRYRRFFYYLHHYCHSLDEGLEFVEPVWCVSLARPSPYPLHFGTYWASRHFIQEMHAGSVAIGRSRRLGRDAS